jgi:GDP-L-fucose synthase
MPTNLYGPGVNFHPENNHVIPVLIRRFHKAKVKNASSVTACSSGNPMREFLHVDDMADVCVYIMNLDEVINDQHTQLRCSHIDVGCGIAINIKVLANVIAKVIGYQGKIEFDTTKPDGLPRKLMGSNRLKAWGWQPRIDLQEGLGAKYQEYLLFIAMAGR